MASSSRVENQNQEKRYKIERKIGDEILQHVRKLELPFQLDQLTEGQGNCFPIAVIQQCRRPEVMASLSSKMQQIVIQENGQSALRVEVVRYVKESHHPRIQAFKLQYTKNVASALGETWEEYWERMEEDRTWVDHKFIQATAWLIECDMLIMDTTCTVENPYIHISGNIENEYIGCKELLYLGSKSNCHYQSLLEIKDETDELNDTKQEPQNIATEIESKVQQHAKKPRQDKTLHTKSQGKKEPSRTEDTADHMQEGAIKAAPFRYKSNKVMLEFKCMSENYMMNCPRCKLDTRYIIQHVSKKASCQMSIDIDTFKKQFQSYKDKDKDKKLKILKEKQQMKRECYKAVDKDKVKE